ncbi:MAG TPA: pyruvate dehydrogenase (acetyl-transferring) E1 component subunit alpha [Tepidisphaeraceae bacterium]|jgi:pyruvate dehydrogenase E1 component alpha subunit|nr:pyruvate dehydrogenase (acetyl-transferring) E1 component subunit alpha [Tepidisphaeraceae bacterium]
MAVANEVEKEPAVRSSTDGRVERDRLRMMMLIRRFEEKTYQVYTQPGQKIGGFCHLYSGQEAIAVGIASIFKHGVDALINGYRCHGHSLALGMNPRAAIAELYGKETGCSKGKGGSMHLFDPEDGNHGGHGIVGGHIPLGLGLAFAQQYKKSGGVTYCLFGDGAINQGTFNEALNLASLFKVPAIFIVENNGVAMGTQVERASAEKDLAQRGAGFAMPHYNIDGNDLDTVIAEMTKASDRARRGEGPTFMVANTFRFRGHSMSDPMKYRSKEEAEKAKLRDPITLYERRLRESGQLTEEQFEELETSVAEEVAEAFRQADEDPHPPLESRFDDILAEKYPYLPK